MESKKVRILAIDDNQDNLISLKALITEAFPGITVLLALTGTSGLELAKTEDPDVVLLDIVMPGMDGYEVCRKLKADPALADIPVVFITALKGDRESRIRALEAGAEAFLAKPVDPSELTAQIRAMVKIKSANIQKRDETERLSRLVDIRTRDLSLANEATLRLLEELKNENEARRKSEAELLQSRETYLNIFNSVEEAIYIQDPETGVFIEVNRGAEKMYEKSRDEIVGQTPFTVAAQGMNDLEDLWEKSQEVFKTGKPIRFDFWALRKNNEVFPKEVIVNKGKYFGKEVLIATARDISEKVRTEETIKRNYTYNKALLDANPDVMFVFDKTCTFIDFHAQSMENVYATPDIFLGKKPEDVLPPDVAKSTREKVENVLKTGKSEYNTYSLEINGETKFYESRGVPLGDDRVLVFVRDITELKTAEELLRENEKFLNLVLQTVPDPVTVVRLSDNVCLQINLEYTKLMGWTAEEVQGRTYKDFNLWVNVDDRVTMIDHLKKYGQVDSLEAQFRTKNGTIITGLISARLLTLKGETCLVTITRDITERKQREEAILLSQERARRQQVAISQLIQDDALISVNIQKSFERLTQIVCKTVDVERASIWLFSEDGSQLVCQSLFEASPDTYGNKPVIQTDDFPAYFEAMRQENIISADDVINDPRTSEMAENYLKVTGISSMLDAGIQLEGQLIGVVCLEHVGKMRHWNADEESFTSTIAAMTGQLIANDHRKKAEEKVNKIAKHYQAIIEKAPDGIVLINEMGRIVFASRSAQRMFGYADGILAETDPARLTYPEDLPMVLNELQKVVENPAYIPTVTYRFVDINQKWHWVESTFTNLYSDPDVNAIVINFRDITDRMQVQAELRESEERFRALHNASFGGIVIHDKGIILECNQGLSEITGYTYNELINMDGLNLIAPQFRDQVMQNILSGYEKPYESAGVRKNGEVYPLRLEARNIPYKGNRVRTVEFRDITDQKRAAEALVESERNYRQVVNTIHETLSVISADGVFLFANNKAAANMSGGGAPEDVVGKNILDFLPETQARQQIQRYRQTIGNDQLLHEEVLITTKSGDKWFLNTLQPIRFGPLRIPAVMSMSLDITDRKKVEIELQNKEHFIKSIAENSPDIIYLFNIQERRNVYTNHNISALLGYSADEISDRDPEFFNKLVHPDDQKQFERFYDEVERWEENQVFDFEYRIKAKSGGWRWFKGREKEFSRIEGRIVSVIGNVQDVTEMKLVEQAVTESEEKFRLLITQMAQGMAVHEAIFDESGEMTDYRFIDMNNSFEVLTGLKREDTIGKRVLEILPGTEKYWIEAYSRVVKTGKPIHFENFHSEIGKYYEVVAYRNREGQFAVIVSDVTQRKKNELIRHIQYNIAREMLTTGSLESFLGIVRVELGKVLDSTNFFVALYNEKTDTLRKVVFLDEKDDFTEWNARNSLSGLVVKQAKTMLVTEEEDRQISLKYNLTLGGTPAACWLGTPLVTNQKAFGVVVIQSYTNPGAYDQSSAALLELVAHEISIFIERQQMIEDLTAAKLKAEENDRLKSAFLANMSHEIRTPMNGILGFTDLLKDPDNTHSEQLRYLEVIEKSGQRLLNLINDLIDISKIEAGQVTVTLAEVDILQEAQNLHAFFLPETEKKSVQLSLHMHKIPGSGKIITDKDKFLSIFTNLVKNAIKFTDEGKIEFGYELSGGFVRFFVKDTGRGIPHDKQEMIFERFGQADVSLTRNHEGAGLGLSISKAYVEMLGGTIGLNSQPGIGSEFYFTLPLPPQTQQIPSFKQEGMEKSGLTEFKKKLKVLVAEDDEFSIQYFSIKLKDIASEIHYTKTGTETVEFCRNNPDIQLVLMDIKMPGIDGLEATQKIREFNKTIIIIAQTAYALSGDRKKALDAGCNDYLAKPINKETLLSMIKKYCT